MRILLICMPFVGLDRPALGPSSLQAVLRAQGHSAEVVYLNFAWADRLGYEDYEWVTNILPYTAFAGDWVFARSLYGHRPRADAEYFESTLQREWGLGESTRDRLLGIRERAEATLDECARAFDWSSYALVGFTSTFTQNLASLAMAQRIKRRAPATKIVFGGANWEAGMGAMLHRRFSFVDFAISGEAESSLPALVETLASSDPEYGDVPGLAYRTPTGECRQNPPGTNPVALERLPAPRFDEYFASHDRYSAIPRASSQVMIEASRGCWWGAKSHCKFCGLNGQSMAFRSKPAHQVLAEMRQLHERHGVSNFAFADNILDMAYFRDLIPQLASIPDPGFNIFFETKSNLRLEHVRSLRDAGVRRIQPGIESLSDHVLKLMAKGTTCLQNVQLLKWCCEFGIEVDWNILYGFPGETARDYEEQRRVLELIAFMGKAPAYGPIRLDRFSPYFERSHEHGLTSVRPMGAYRALYPFPERDRHEIAYYFDFSYREGRTREQFALPVLDVLRRWERSGPRGALVLHRKNASEVQLRDLRGLAIGNDRPRTIRGWRARVYLAADAARPIESLLRTAGRRHANHAARFIDEECELGTMLRVNDRVLALGVHHPPRTAAPPPVRSTRRQPEPKRLTVLA